MFTQPVLGNITLLFNWTMTSDQRWYYWLLPVFLWLPDPLLRQRITCNVLADNTLLWCAGLSTDGDLKQFKPINRDRDAPLILLSPGCTLFYIVYSAPLMLLVTNWQIYVLPPVSLWNKPWSFWGWPQMAPWPISKAMERTV